MGKIQVKRSDKGFTLVEVMVSVVLIGVLAAVAIPSYTESVKKTRRADAQSSLMGLSSAMERYYSTNNTYIGIDDDADGFGLIPAENIFASETPLGGSEKFYDLRIDDLKETSFTIMAIPKGAQQSNGRLKLTSTGERAWDKENDDSFSEDW